MKTIDVDAAVNCIGKQCETCNFNYTFENTNVSVCVDEMFRYALKKRLGLKEDLPRGIVVDFDDDDYNDCEYEINLPRVIDHE